MNIADFLPSYPDTDPQVSLYDLYEGETFNQVIYQKREFNELKLREGDEKRPDNDLLDRQKIISRFLSSHTLYDELLLFHAPGTGKTCSSIGVVENLIYNPSSGIKRALVLVKNHELITRFKEEIIFTCGNKRYLPEDEPDDDKLNVTELRKRRFDRGNKLLKNKYTFRTHESFVSNFLSQNPENWKRIFSNSVIIIDEVHNLSHSLGYHKYFEFLHALDNRKILLMTGTPMVNEASDIARVMNLILPEDKQIPIGSLFDSEFFTDGSLNNADVLEERFRGRISYLTSQTDIQSVYIGRVIQPIDHFKLFPSEMSDHQYNTYSRVFSEDSGWKDNSQHASLFVFPDGTVGMTGFKKYVTKHKHGYSAKFIHDISRYNTVGEKLAIIHQWSSKYASVISNILENPKQNCFVFTESIHGGGAIILGLLLELFNFKRVQTGKVQGGKKQRYCILSGDTDIKSILGSFNSRSNANGDYIRVLIGGRKIAEGFTFKSIQQIHILTPHYNFSVIDQAIARGIRSFAHSHLPPNTVVRIFLHVSVYKNYPWDSFIDLVMYDTCQRKDTAIQEIIHLIKTSCFDCALTYAKNVVAGSDNGSRNCQYTDCLYSCSGITNIDAPLDDSTFQLYYNDRLVEELIVSLTGFFRLHFSIPLYFLETSTNATRFDLFRALNRIMNENIIFTNKYGFDCYLQEDNNIYFLQPTIQKALFTDSYYIEHPVMRENKSLQSIIGSKDFIQQEVAEILSQTFSQQKNSIPISHPSIQRMFIENAIEAGDNNELASWILNYYKDFIVFEGPDIYVIFNKESRRFVDGVWKEAVLEKQLYLKSPVYGIMKNGVFSIVDLRKVPVIDRQQESRKNVGRACSSYHIKDLIEIANFIGMELQEAKITKNILCSRLREWFTNNELL
jgi:hypothetical protein